LPAAAALGRLLPDVAQLVGIDDRAQCRDVAGSIDVEREHGEQIAGSVRDQRAGLAVDLYRVDQPSAERLAGVYPLDQQSGDLRSTLDGPSDGAHLAATVAVEHDVVGQQLLERLQIAALDRGEKAAREFVAPL